MNFFKKRKQTETKPQESKGFTARFSEQSDLVPESLKAYSVFIKRINCVQCGAPKSLPSKTAYLYCDYCGALMDYDFRIANADTNAGLTNTVYHRIYAAYQARMAQAKAMGNKEECRRLYREIYTQWLKECPTAASPRAYNDTAFREQFINYQVECFVSKDFDPKQAELEANVQRLASMLQRVPTPDGTWRAVGPFWEYAETFKKQMEIAYDEIHKQGIDALDPDHAPAGIPLRIEYSYFCQAWLPHLTPEEGDRLLKFFGLSGEYYEYKFVESDSHKCGSCGSEILHLPGAKQVICENCGFTIDVGSQPLPCRKCGALLSFPVSAKQITCPYCQTNNQRV